MTALLVNPAAGYSILSRLDRASRRFPTRTVTLLPGDLAALAAGFGGGCASVASGLAGAMTSCGVLSSRRPRHAFSSCSGAVA
jgi:hypothetical protein